MFDPILMLESAKSGQTDVLARREIDRLIAKLRAERQEQKSQASASTELWQAA